MKTYPEHLSSGQAAEDYALSYLQNQGLQLVTRNYRWRGGEIDLIMRDEQSLVFVEVRLRRNQRFGGALASVDQRKQQRLIQCAHHYLCHHKLDTATRFDVVALSERNFHVHWVQDAFQANP